MVDKSEIWLRTDEAEDVAGSVRHAIRCLELVETDPQAWKWFVIAVHSALQGACVCHLVTTATPVGVVNDRQASNWLNFIQLKSAGASIPTPKTHLLPFNELLSRIRASRSDGNRSIESGILISDSEYEWLKRFNDGIRNQFAHFEPMAWSVEVSGLPEIGTLVSRIVIDILAAGWAFRHKPQHWRDNLLLDLKRFA